MNPRHRTTPRANLWSWAAGGAILGLLLTLALAAPARWLALALEQSSAGRVMLLTQRGTLWDGSGQLVLTGGPDSHDAAPLPGRITWALRPSWNHIELQLQSPCCAPQTLVLRAQPRWGGMHLSVQDGVSQWPAAVLTGLGTPWNTLQPQGNLSLTTQGLTLEWVQGRLALAGQAKLQASAMSSSLSTLKPMGSYLLTLQGGPSTTLQLETLEGSLHLNGSGRWVDQRLHFQGEASAAPEHLEALSNLLNIIGRRNGARSIIQVG
jgi:general secretion pathway protein N